MAVYLIDRTDWNTYKKKLGANVDFDADVKPIILEAQFHDLRPLLTQDFYDEVIAVAETSADSGNLSLVNYNLLLPYLKPALVYFAYARYIQAAQLHDSRYGQVMKKNPYSENVSPAAIDRQARNNRSMAVDHFSIAKDFLEENLSNYTTYRDAVEAPQKRTSVRFSTLD